MVFQKSNLQPGLTFVGVPIGTARDITLRALDTLASVDVLVAEDTRALRRLMDIHGIPVAGRKMISLHDHSSAAQVAGLVDMVRGGASLAYASEAGMPAIADPGFELARALQDADLLVTCAPGPSAAPTALALAGLPTDRFLFLGFLPSSQVARRTALQAVAEVDATLLLYESPKRIAACLKDAEMTLGAERQAALCRELTKKFEEVRRGTLAELAAFYATEKVKGELVLLIDRNRLQFSNPSALEEDMRAALAAMSVRDAADAMAQAHNVPRRQMYKLALKITAERDDE